MVSGEHVYRSLGKNETRARRAGLFMSHLQCWALARYELCLKNGFALKYADLKPSFSSSWAARSITHTAAQHYDPLTCSCLVITLVGAGDYNAQ